MKEESWLYKLSLPIINSFVLTIWFFSYLLPDVQKLTGEIGGPAQAFMSLIIFPTSLIFGLFFYGIIIRPLFKYFHTRKILFFPIILMLPIFSIFMFLTGLRIIVLPSSLLDFAQYGQDFYMVIEWLGVSLGTASILFWSMYKEFKYI